MTSVGPSFLFYFLPLLVAISVVFGFTRHEHTDRMIAHSLATARWIGGFMLLLFGVLLVLNYLQ